MWNNVELFCFQSRKSKFSLANTKWTLADNVKGKIPTLNIEGEKSAEMQDATITLERQK
jgi:hypothetical protein